MAKNNSNKPAAKKAAAAKPAKKAPAKNKAAAAPAPAKKSLSEKLDAQTSVDAAFIRLSYPANREAWRKLIDADGRNLNDSQAITVLINKRRYNVLKDSDFGK